MNKTILFCLIILSGLSACKKEKLVVNTDMIGVRISSHLMLNKDIATEYDSLFKQDISRITEGDFLLFKYIWSKNRYSSADGGQAISLVFKVPSYLPQFEYTNEQILATACYYKSTGGFYYYQYAVKTGNIKGIKQANGDWEITASIWTTPANSGEEPIQLEFSRTFSEETN